MAHIKNLCLIRDIYKALDLFEQTFIDRIGLTIREAFVICSLSDGALPANEINRHLGALPPNTSKLLRNLEDGGYIVRQFGEEDKRMTFFSLTDRGYRTLSEIKEQECHYPPILRPLMDPGKLNG